MTTRELAQYLQVSERSIYRWRQLRQGPPWTRVGHQVRYLRDEVDKYLRQKQFWPPRTGQHESPV